MTSVFYYRCLTHQQIRDAHVILVIYDMLVNDEDKGETLADRLRARV